MKFIEILERIIGKRSERPSMTVIHDGKISGDELLGLAELTRLTFREEPETYTGGQKLNIITTQDVNPKTGKLYPDYLERRAARRLAEEKECAAGTIGHDVRPD
jgi:hypothetical protein